MPEARPIPWPGIGYLVLFLGTVLGMGLAWRYQQPDTDENPLEVLVMIWAIAGIAHIFIRRFWPACAIAALGSAIGYVAISILFTPDPFGNEMFMAGVIQVGLFGFGLAMYMGVPVLIYRRARNRGTTVKGAPPAGSAGPTADRHEPPG